MMTCSNCPREQVWRRRSAAVVVASAIGCSASAESCLQGRGRYPTALQAASRGTSTRARAKIRQAVASLGAKFEYLESPQEQVQNQAVRSEKTSNDSHFAFGGAGAWRSRLYRPHSASTSISCFGVGFSVADNRCHIKKHWALWPSSGGGSPDKAVVPRCTQPGTGFYE